MFALDTNLLVYAHNVDAPFHKAAKAFVEKVLNERDSAGNLTVCIPAQVLVEFLNVITWAKLESPLPLPAALRVVQQYMDTGVTIVPPLPSQLDTLLELLATVKTRKKIFDVALAATLRDNGIVGLYTLNTKDFIEFTFLDVVNPLANV
jgi:predicted nucleic acid-binding protein